MKGDKIYLSDVSGSGMRAIKATECGRPNITSKWFVGIIDVGGKAMNYYHYRNPKFWYLEMPDRWYRISIDRYPLLPSRVIILPEQ